MTKDEALKLALVALERYETKRQDDRFAELITAIREALAQPEQEPECVAVINVLGNDWRLEQLSLPVGKHRLYAQQYTYTAPPKRTWVGLTVEQIEDVGFNLLPTVARKDFVAFARYVEMRAKELNA